MRQVTRIAFEIGTAHQRPVNSGRRDFQAIRPVDGIGHVEHRRQRARGRLAILNGHGSVRALGHDLHRATGRTGNAHAHEAVTKVGEHRLSENSDAGRSAGLGNKPWLISKASQTLVHLVRYNPLCILKPGAECPGAQVIKKSGSRGAHSQNRSDDRTL